MTEGFFMPDFPELSDMEAFVNLNGQLIPSGQAVIPASSRGFRYGDGLFETMKVKNSRILLGDYHFDRLFTGLSLLEIVIPPDFNQAKLEREVIRLCRKNQHEASGRVRMVLFRGEGGLFELQSHPTQFLIESSALESHNPKETLCIDIFPDGRKSMDKFGNLKSNNYQLYAQSALYAKKNGLDSCLILNSAGRICDSSIENVFCIRNRMIYTPPLSEGGIAGVMRRFLLANMAEAGYLLMEKTMEIEFVKHADELFLTNAIRGIRSVKRFAEKDYDVEISMDIRKKMDALLLANPTF
jgi:branched-chain amino acid aminotransferase